MKKNYLLLVIILFLTLLTTGCLDIFSHNYGKVTKIEYTFSNSYGTEAGTAKRHVIFNPDGKVLLSNDYDSSTDSFYISQQEYEELVDYIVERMNVFDQKAVENDDVMDGNYSSISIEFSEGETKSMGGYMITNDQYVEIEKQIRTLLDNDIYRDYVKQIGQ